MGKTARLNRKGAGRDPGGFVALPWSVLDSSAYQSLSHPARSLLMELARQYVRDNNGRLLCSMAYLGPRGWSSNDVITRALRELVAAGFVHQTVQGHRPSKASWYAITWQTLDRHTGYDAGAVEGFQRSAYRHLQQDSAPRTAPSRGVGMALSAPSGGAVKIAPLTPRDGAEGGSTAPSRGVGRGSTAPSGGAVEGVFDRSSTPSDGDHLEKPSVGSFGAGGSGAGESSDAQAIATLAELWGRIGCRSVWRTIRAAPTPAPAANRSQQRKAARRSDRVAAGRKAMQEAMVRGGAQVVGVMDARAACAPQSAASGDGWTRDRGDVNEPEPWADW